MTEPPLPQAPKQFHRLDSGLTTKLVVERTMADIILAVLFELDAILLNQPDQRDLVFNPANHLIR